MSEISLLLLYYAMLCYVMLCYNMLCYTMQCLAILCYMLCYAKLSYAMQCHATLCYAMLCYVLCYAMLCYMLCYAMPCYAMLCYAMLCYAICYAMLCWEWTQWLQRNSYFYNAILICSIYIPAQACTRMYLSTTLCNGVENSYLSHFLVISSIPPLFLNVTSRFVSTPYELWNDLRVSPIKLERKQTLT